jgi:hypothetical protein
MPPPPIEPELQAIMVRLIMEGASYREAGAAVGLGPKAARNAYVRVHGAAKGHSQARRDMHAKGNGYRRHTLSEEVFDSIESEAAAYWLGFLAADGTVVCPVSERPPDTIDPTRQLRGKSKSYSVQLELQSEDRAHLEKFKTFLSSSAPITLKTSVLSGKRVQQPRITISSKRMVQRLINLGVVPNKSASLSPCTEVPSELLRHYWRGLIDGDGGLRECPPNMERGKLSPYWVIALTGTEAICSGFLDYLRACGIETDTEVKPDGIGIARRAEVGGVRLAQEVARLLYGDATVYLERKHDSALKLLAQKPRDWFRDVLTKAVLTQLLASGRTQRSIADEYGVSEAALSQLIKEYGIRRGR